MTGVQRKKKREFKLVLAAIRCQTGVAVILLSDYRCCKIKQGFFFFKRKSLCLWVREPKLLRAKKQKLALNYWEYCQSFKLLCWEMMKFWSNLKKKPMTHDLTQDCLILHSCCEWLTTATPSNLSRQFSGLWPIFAHAQNIHHLSTIKRSQIHSYFEEHKTFYTNSTCTHKWE